MRTKRPTVTQEICPQTYGTKSPTCFQVENTVISLSDRGVNIRVRMMDQISWSSAGNEKTGLTFGNPPFLGFVAIQAHNEATLLTHPVDVEERHLAGVAHLPHPSDGSLPRQLG